MENILLIGILAATFVFGFFVVRQVDRALDTGWKTPEEPQRIGFAAPSPADCLSGTWEGIPVCLFSGTAEELLPALGAEELDLIFLPDSADISPNLRYNVRKLRLPALPVRTTRTGQTVIPLNREQPACQAVWLQTGMGSFVDRLEKEEHIG